MLKSLVLAADGELLYGYSRWVAWFLVVLSLGIVAISLQDFGEDDFGEGVTGALLGLVVGVRGTWMLWHGRSR